MSQSITPTLNRALIVKHAGGAPTKYNEALLDKVIQYANSFTDLGHKVPSIAGLSTYIGISRDRIYVWIKEYPQLKDTIDQMMARWVCRVISVEESTRLKELGSR